MSATETQNEANRASRQHSPCLVTHEGKVRSARNALGEEGYGPDCLGSADWQTIHARMKMERALDVLNLARETQNLQNEANGPAGAANAGPPLEPTPKNCCAAPRPWLPRKMQIEPNRRQRLGSADRQTIHTRMKKEPTLDALNISHETRDQQNEAIGPAGAANSKMQIEPNCGHDPMAPPRKREEQTQSPAPPPNPRKSSRTFPSRASSLAFARLAFTRKLLDEKPDRPVY